MTHKPKQISAAELLFAPNPTDPNKNIKQLNKNVIVIFNNKIANDTFPYKTQLIMIVPTMFTS